MVVGNTTPSLPLPSRFPVEFNVFKFVAWKTNANYRRYAVNQKAFCNYLCSPASNAEYKCGRAVLKLVLWILIINWKSASSPPAAVYLDPALNIENWILQNWKLFSPRFHEVKNTDTNPFCHQADLDPCS